MDQPTACIPFEKELIGKIALSFIDSSLDLIYRRDRYTAAHCISVGMLAGELAKGIGLSEFTVKELALAGRAHDIGKLTWDDSCFSSQHISEMGRSSDLMLLHSTDSKNFLYNSLKDIYNGPQNPNCGLKWIEWVWLHHWGFDEDNKINPPRGDPKVQDLIKCSKEKCLSQDEFELGFGILHVADSFHAGISGRSYRKDHPQPKSVKNVIQELHLSSGSNYHPLVVKEIIKLETWLKYTFLPNVYTQ